MKPTCIFMCLAVVLHALACSTDFHGSEDGEDMDGVDQETDGQDADAADPDADASDLPEGDATECPGGSCLIMGNCYVDGDLRPDNACQRCDVAASDSAWSFMPTGSPCDDGEFCNGEDVCNDVGDCLSLGAPCPDNADCFEEEPNCRCRPGWHGERCDVCHRYVAPGGRGDGTAWDRAMGGIQDAIDSAMEAGCDEVWARDGLYSLGETLIMKGNVGIFGGFNGTEAVREDRNFYDFNSIIGGHGEVGPLVLCVEGTCLDGARLDGFQLIEAVNTGTSPFGGGMAVQGVSPTIANCTFRDNEAGSGGGLFLRESNAQVLACKFIRNSANNGGAVHMIGNEALTATPYFENCLLWGNEAETRGGGLYQDHDVHATVMNCTISDNVAHTSMSSIAPTRFGGGIAIFDCQDDRMTVMNAIVFHNTAFLASGTSVASQIECIFYDPDLGGPEIISIGYTDIEGGCTDCTDLGGNISQNPSFFDWGGHDYHIRATGEVSPCIDMGLDTDAPDHDLDGMPRIDTPDVGPVGVLTDMGCYEAR